MDRKTFAKEVESYSDDDLELIIKTQQDLYDADEMDFMRKELQRRKEQQLLEKFSDAPESVFCPKCGFENPFENDQCAICGCYLGYVKGPDYADHKVNVEMTAKAQRDFQLKLQKYREKIGTPDAITEAKLFAQAVELQTLKAPATAQFCDLDQMTITENPKGELVVSGFVDSQNSYGALIRTPFDITVFKDGDVWKNVDKFFPVGKLNKGQTIGVILLIIGVLVDPLAVVFMFSGIPVELFSLLLFLGTSLFIAGLILLFTCRRR